MHRILIRRAHALGLAAARAEVERIARRAAAALGATWRWQGDTLVFSHRAASGRVSLSGSAAELQLDLRPWLWPLRARIEAALVAKADRALASYAAAAGVGTSVGTSVGASHQGP